MPFTLPKFINNCNIWRPPNEPPDPPDQLELQCQFYFTPKGQWAFVDASSDAYGPPIYLRVPMGSDVQVNDLVEVENGDGNFYTIRFVERVHLGFPNEYLVAILEQGVAGPPPSGDAILLEGGDDILLEVGDPILVE